MRVVRLKKKNYVLGFLDMYIESVLILYFWFLLKEYIIPYTGDGMLLESSGLKCSSCF